MLRNGNRFQITWTLYAVQMGEVEKEKRNDNKNPTRFNMQKHANKTGTGDTGKLKIQQKMRSNRQMIMGFFCSRSLSLSLSVSCSCSRPCSR